MTEESLFETLTKEQRQIVAPKRKTRSVKEREADTTFCKNDPTRYFWKRCPRCGLWQPKENYYTARAYLDKVTSVCILCSREYAHVWSRENPNKRKEAAARERQSPGHLEKQREYNRRDYVKLRNRKRTKRYQTDNLEKVKKSRARTYQKRKNDPVFLAVSKARRRIRRILHTHKTKKSVDYIGCTREAYLSHLRRTMETENFSVVHIDHIIPCNVFDFTMPGQAEICFNYRNQRLLSPAQNQSRPRDGSDLTIKDIQPLIDYFGIDLIAPLVPHLTLPASGTPVLP